MEQIPRVTEEQIEYMNRPDNELPPTLRHEDIREVRDRSSAGRHMYQIVFDQEFLPYAYARTLRKSEWELTYARVEHHQPDGLFGFLRAPRCCITIVVGRDAPDVPFGGDE